MDPADLERLRFLLAALREDRPSKEAERRAVEAFKRWWPAPALDSRKAERPATEQGRED